MDLLGDDRYIAITNERSGEVVIAARDEKTGLIGEAINRRIWQAKFCGGKAVGYSEGISKGMAESF